MLFQRVVRWCRSAAGGRWWIVFLVSGAFSSLVLAQPPCGTDITCNVPWRQKWIPQDSGLGLLLEGSLWRSYPWCWIRAKVWIRCCDWRRQIFIEEVEIMGNNCRLDSALESGEITAAQLMDEVIITILVNQELLQDTCFPGLSYCSQGGNRYFEAYRVNCFGLKKQRFRCLYAKTRLKDEGEIAHREDTNCIRIRQWVWCGVSCCAEEWEVCRKDPGQPCTSPNRNPCIEARKRSLWRSWDCRQVPGVEHCEPTCEQSGGLHWNEGGEVSRVAEASEVAEDGVTRVYDILGRLVAEYRAGEVEKERLRQSLARGIYVVVRWLPGGQKVEYIRVP